MLAAKNPEAAASGVLIVCVLFVVLQGVKAFCAGTNLNDVLYVVDEDLAVADVAGIQNLLDDLNDRLDRNLGDNDLHLELREQGYIDLSAAVILGSALLYAAADNVRYRHAGYADACQRFLEYLKFGLLGDDDDLAQLVTIGRCRLRW